MPPICIYLLGLWEKKWEELFPNYVPPCPPCVWKWGVMSPPGPMVAPPMHRPTCCSYVMWLDTLHCFNLKHCYFIEWHHWCHRPDQCSSSCLTSWNKKVGQDCWTSSSTFIYSQYSVILRWCCQIEHLLHLRQLLSSTTIHDYIFNINIHPSITTSTTVLL